MHRRTRNTGHKNRPTVKKNAYTKIKSCTALQLIIAIPMNSNEFTEFDIKKVKILT